ncbi:hypothetical protein CEXT_7771 [Caerostris extrusa]|uniref:Secreted protein n=1 Tax=Caerostris extrusa TaxID=172846 RepID=A0AAV4UJT6_CAEEX|nr:hypothetical protein CEXT_7771 [Caerostris extrusa]
MAGKKAIFALKSWMVFVYLLVPSESHCVGFGNVVCMDSHHQSLYLWCCAMLFYCRVYVYECFHRPMQCCHLRCEIRKENIFSEDLDCDWESTIGEIDRK